MRSLPFPLCAIFEKMTFLYSRKATFLNYLLYYHLPGSAVYALSGFFDENIFARFRLPYG